MTEDEVESLKEKNDSLRMLANKLVRERDEESNRAYGIAKERDQYRDLAIRLAELFADQAREVDSL